MQKISDLFSEYKYSLLLVTILFTYFLVSKSFALFDDLIQELFSIRWNVFFLTIFAAYIGSLSFVLPFFSLMPKKKLSLSKLISKTLNWVHQSILVENAEKNFIKEMKISDIFFFKKVALSDMLAILFLICLTYPFIQINREFFSLVLIFEIIFGVYFVFSNKHILSKEFIFSIPASISRYFLEMFAPLLIFSSMNIFLDLPTLLFFTASTSFLYYIPKFKLAGGLLDAYLVLMFSFLGNPLRGLVAAILFRLMSVLFFVFPLYFINK